jgi:hypothetical protein
MPPEFNVEQQAFIVELQQARLGLVGVASVGGGRLRARCPDESAMVIAIYASVSKHPGFRCASPVSLPPTAH